MTQARVNLSEKTNQVLNIVKAKHCLKGKSEAIDFIVAEYENKVLERQYKPEFIKDMLETENDKVIGPFKNADELKAYIESLPDED